MDVPDDLLAQLTDADASASAVSALLDALPDGILVVDRVGTIRYATAKVAALTGYDVDDLVGSAVERLVPDALRAAHVGHRERFGPSAQDRPMGADLDIELQRSDGTTVPVDISLAPVGQGRHTAVVAAIRDATDRRTAERKVREALEREQRASAELRELSALRDTYMRALSHDLRSPLAASMGLLGTVREHADRLTPEEVDDLLGRAFSNGQRLERVLNDLLELDRATRAAGGIEREVLDVRALVRAVADDLAVELPRVEIADEEQPLTWPVGRAQLVRLLENLLLNAAKHAPSDAPIDVAIELDEGVDEGRALHITVADRGPGVPADERAHIFEPFTRGAEVGDAPGSGVGLSLVQAFARAHGGRAWVDGRDGGGATFHVTLGRG